MKVIIVGNTGTKDAVISAPFTDPQTPVLYVKKDEIPALVWAEILRLAPDTILVFGGTLRVSDAVVAELETVASVTRIAGPSVYSTAVAASQMLNLVVVEPPVEPSTDLYIPKLNGPILGKFTDAEKATMPTYTGPTNITDTQVLEGYKIPERISVRDAGHLTLRNCWVYGDTYYTVWNDTRTGPSVLEIYDSEIGDAGALSERGLAGGSITAKRCYIHHVEDGIKLGSNSVYEQITVERLDSPAGDPHADCAQADGDLSNVDIGFCYFAAYSPNGTAENAAIIIKSDLGPQDDVRVHDSLLAGGAWTVYVRDGGNGYGPPTNVSFVSNVLDDRLPATFEGRAYGLLSNDSPDLVWMGNTDLTTGDLV